MEHPCGILILNSYLRRWNTPVEVPNYESDDDDKVSIKVGFLKMNISITMTIMMVIIIR